MDAIDAGPQAIQEEQYRFPYHYLDLVDSRHVPFVRPHLTALREVAKRQLEPFVGQSILDAGCGDARFLFELRYADAELFGADYSEAAIGFARAFNPRARFWVQSLTELDLGRRFDQIVCLETLEHLPPETVPLAVDRLADHLAEPGRIVVSVPSNLYKPDRKHYQHFSAESLAQVLAPRFEVETVTGYGVDKRFYRPRFRTRRRAAKLLTSLAPKSELSRRLRDRVWAHYMAEYAVGDPEKCVGLLAVARPR
ncbi:MAG: class I SAM-dependent methyltransferase [Fimbriimonadaceae bacterium]